MGAHAPVPPFGTMDLAEGKIIAEHYKLLKQLGHGSFGDVWLAHNMLADIDVAIKFYGTLDMKGLDEFRKEFKMTYKLHHANLLNINHFDVYENCPYLVMPYCANGSVNSRAGQMPESEIWKFIYDVSGGLAFLHSQQPPIVHQDIKPDNILITSDGRYVISDFGISRSFRTKMSRTNNTNVATSSSGTIAYMGPERFSEKPMIVFASDIWALGMTIYELMTGDVLWEGMGGCVQLNGARIPVIEGNFSKELTSLVTSCLAAETWNRPTAPQINEYASAYLQNKPLPKLPTQNLQKTEPISEPKPEPRQEQSRPAYQPSYQPAYSPQMLSDRRSTATERPRVSQTSGSSSGNSQTWKKWLLIGAACIAALALIMGAISFISTMNEDDDFYSCRTRQDYEQFIKEYPNSSHVETALKRIASMTPAEAPALQAQDAPQQKGAENGKASRQDKQAEVITIPDEQPENLQAAQTEEKPQPAPVTPSNNKVSEDDQAFYKCVTANDYDAYLKKFPNGRHRQAAADALGTLVTQVGTNAGPATAEVYDDNPVRSGGSQPVPQMNQGLNTNSNTRITNISIGGGGRPYSSGPSPRYSSGGGPSRSSGGSSSHSQGSRGPMRSHR